MKQRPRRPPRDHSRLARRKRRDKLLQSTRACRRGARSVRKVWRRGRCAAGCMSLFSRFLLMVRIAMLDDVGASPCHGKGYMDGSEMLCIEADEV